ncbi:MAG: 30S ribosomal protein S6 [Prochloraceae cyanobacterium]|nr:30S ribosomal protein S6 [Prochloraceae cyanobacterium]
MNASYEMMYILRPDLTEEQVQQTIAKYKDFLKDRGAEDFQIKIWGKRRLAYEIKRFQDGIYILMNYRADGKQVAPLEKAMRQSEEVIRYLTIALAEDLPVSTSEEEPEAPVEAAAPVEAPVEAVAPVDAGAPVEAPVEAAAPVEAPVEAVAPETPVEEQPPQVEVST